MEVTVYIEREQKEKKIEMRMNAVVSELLTQLKINPVEVLIARDNELIAENEKLNHNDKIKILPVVSGG